MKTVILLLLFTAAALAADSDLDVNVHLDARSEGRIFDGIGGASGGGAVSRLLVNYPDRQRSEILDYLFRPNYGASLQSLKVEIGGDGNSTEGSEPSHMHGPGDENYDRGFEWWLMKEARGRNPSIVLMALAWDFPGWLKKANSQETADYLIKFLEGAKSTQGLDIDYIGIWNETKMDYDFIKRLKRTLIAHRLKTKIIADDLVNTWALADGMKQDKELREAVTVLATHYPRFSSTEAARNSGKPIWSSEDGPWTDVWGSGGEQSGPYAELLNRNYVQGRMTSTVLWCATTSYYDILDIPYAGLLRAATPWSGHYQAMSPIWITAHTTQFAKPGWRYMDSASGLLAGGGSYVTLHHNGDYSMIIETISAAQPYKVHVKPDKSLSRRQVAIWRTNAHSSFERLKTLTPENGGFQVEVELNSIYSVTSTSGQLKGVTHPPRETEFPLPYRDNFDGYAIGSTTPNYFIEQNGSYEVRPCEGGRRGQCLTQVVNTSPIVWTYGTTADLLGTASIIGDKRWRDYRVSSDVLFEEPGYGRVMGRVSRVTLDGQISGYQLYLFSSGKWELRTSTKGGMLASGTVPIALNTWHHLDLAFDGNRIRANIDQKIVADVSDETFAVGMAGLGNGWNIGQYDNFEITPIRAVQPVIFAPPKKPSTGVPAAPTIFVPTALDQSVRLTWSAVSEADGYKIHFGLKQDNLTSEVNVGRLTAYKVTTLTNNTTYFFSVSAYNDRGSSKQSGAASATPMHQETNAR